MLTLAAVVGSRRHPGFPCPGRVIVPGLFRVGTARDGGSAARLDPCDTVLHGFRNWRQPPGRVVWPTSIRCRRGRACSSGSRSRAVRWREELGASRAPLRIHSVDVRDPDVEEAAGQIRIVRCLECDCRLIVGRAATDVDDDPAVGERHVRRLTRADGLAAEYLRVEAAGALHVARNDDVPLTVTPCRLGVRGYERQSSDAS